MVETFEVEYLRLLVQEQREDAEVLRGRLKMLAEMLDAGDDLSLAHARELVGVMLICSGAGSGEA